MGATESHEYFILKNPCDYCIIISMYFRILVCLRNKQSDPWTKESWSLYEKEIARLISKLTWVDTDVQWNMPKLKKSETRKGNNTENAHFLCVIPILPQHPHTCFSTFSHFLQPSACITLTVICRYMWEGHRNTDKKKWNSWCLGKQFLPSCQMRWDTVRVWLFQVEDQAVSSKVT